MDFENNGKDVANFMAKIKKQAKRLFQLSKTKPNTMQIKNLSHSQEILAQINGYSDWHSLEKHISSVGNTNQNQNILKSDLNKGLSKEYEMFEELCPNLYFYEEDDKITTILRFNEFPCEMNLILKTIYRFNDLFSFALNMNMHDISIIIDGKNKKDEKQLSYSLCEVSEGFNITQEEAKSLFYIETSNKTVVNQNDLFIYLSVTTSRKYKVEHENFCLSLKKELNGKSFENYYLQISLESIPYLAKSDLEILKIRNDQNYLKDKIDKIDKLNEKLFKNINFTDVNEKDKEEKMINKYIYLLNFLTQSKIGFLLDYSLNKKQMVYSFEKYEENKERIDNFVNASIKTNQFMTHNLNYLKKDSLEFVKSASGALSLKSMINNKIINYNQLDNKRTHLIDFIYGPVGTGKSVLSNVLCLNSIIKNKVEDMPKMGIIDIGAGYAGLVKLIKEILPLKYKDTIKTFDITNSADCAINIFDLPLGKRIYEDEDIQRIYMIILSLVGEDELKQVSAIIYAALSHLNNDYHKIFDRGINIEIDRQLDNLNFISNNKTTWWNIVDFLFMNENPELALKAQKFATPVLSDFISILSLEEIKDIYGNIYIKNNQNLICYVRMTLRDMINKYPFIDKSTRLELGKIKFAFFNLDRAIVMNDNITDYWFCTILNLISHQHFNINNFNSSYLITQSGWNKPYQDYLKTESLDKIYAYYNNTNNTDTTRISKELIINELHRFNLSDSLVSIIRESRKNNVSIKIATQSLLHFNFFKDIATAFFISRISFSEHETLLQAGFKAHELKMLENFKMSQWGIRLNTIQDSVFDILKIDITTQLILALSSLQEDIIILDKVNKHFDYFIALKKCDDYLTKTNSRTFKKSFEFQLDKNRDKRFTDIVSDISRDIIENY